MSKEKLYAIIIVATIFTIAATITATKPTPSPTTPTANQPDTTTGTRGLKDPSPPRAWNKTYGGSGDDYAHCVQQTSDGGFIVAGCTKSFGAGDYDFWLVKTDANGKMQWNRTYGGTGEDRAFSVQQTSDNGYIVAGYTKSFGAGEYDFWLVKTDSAGNQQWSRTYGGPSDDVGHSVQQTLDGGYIVAGETSSFTFPVHAWLVKTDSLGNVEWSKTCGSGTENTWAQSVQQTSDGGYIMAGDMIPLSSPLRFYFWIWKTNSTGDTEWNRPYPGGDFDFAEEVRETSDGGYIAAGMMYSEAAGSKSWLVKTDSAGNPLWNKTYGGTGYDEAYSVRQTSDGGYITAGATTSFGAGSWDLWLVKTDSTGNQQWNKTYGGPGEDAAVSVRLTSDGGYIIAGATNSTGAGGNDFWLVKTWGPVPPSTIVDLVAGSPTISSITLTWTAPGDDGMNGNATGYVVKYSASGPIDASNWDSSTTYAQSWIPARNGTTETHVVTGLASGTEYWFAVEAYDKEPNYGGVSDSPSATTLPDTTAPSTITDLATSNPIDNSVTLTWTAPGDDGMTGNTTGYMVKYSSSGPITEANWNSATTFSQYWTPAKNGTTEIHNVTSLSPQTTYWFAVEAYDEASPPNYGSVSNSPSATTAKAPVLNVRTLDWSSNPLPSCTVNLIDVGSVISDSYGWANFTSVPTGTYTLCVSWDGSKVNQMSVAVSGVGVTINAKCHVWSLTINGKESTGATLLQPNNMQIYVTLPNGTHVNPQNVNSVTWKVQNGTYYLAVRWQGSWVYGNTSASLDTTNPTRDLLCRVYSLSFTFKDNSGTSPLYKNPYQILLLCPNASSVVVASYSGIAAQNGSYMITSVTWNGINVVPSPNPDFSLTGSGSQEIRCLVYDLGIKVVDDYGLPIEGATVTVTLPNGTTVSGLTEVDGFTTFSQCPCGSFNGTASFLSGTISIAGDVSRTHSFTIDLVLPAAITDLTATGATSTSITLTWTAPGDAGMMGNATGYVVKYSTSGPITSGNWNSATTYTQTWIPVKNGTTETHEVSGLTPGTQYWFAIKAYDDASPSNYSGISNSPSGTTASDGTQKGIELYAILIGATVVTVVVVLVGVVVKRRKK